MSQPVLLLIAFIVGYLLGSIPFGLIFTRLAGTQDLRSVGSGNIGATNVLRTGRRGLAAATLVCDALKGTAAVIVGAYLGGPEAAIVAAVGAFLGHLFPAWIGFRGGKGVATYIGLLIGLFWPAAIAFCVLWLIVAVVTRYSSASALIASIAIPVLFWWLGHPALAELFALLTVLLWLMHRENIQRLLAGTEGKIGQTVPEMAGHNGGPPLGG
jgi:acyl phosphate:glycerol-3-phosphate acyltransferase